MAIRDYIRERFFPHIWCPGCGHGMVLNGLLRAIEKIGLDKNEIVMVSGIGCSARIAGYVDFHTMHTIHGRALAFAAGIKMSRPELKLIVPMGDGDALAIGGNHFCNCHEQPCLWNDRRPVFSFIRLWDDEYNITIFKHRPCF